MRRGDLYRVHKPKGGDPKSHRVFVVVSRQALIDSNFSSVICAPILTIGQGLSTQVAVGVAEGLKHPSWIMCDALTSIQKWELTSYVGSISRAKMAELSRAINMALDLD